VALDSQQWSLFGYDLRAPARQLRAAWNDVLWGPDAVLGRLLDEPVSVRRLPDEQQGCYRAGRPVPMTTTRATAIALPDDEVLQRELVLPASAESELQGLVAGEVRAASPFPPDDTRSGYAVVSRTRQTLRIAVAIVSAASVQQWARQHGIEGGLSVQEVWAFAGQRPVVIGGFGEHGRAARVSVRLRRSLSVLLACLAMLLLSAVVLAFAERVITLRVMAAHEALMVSARPALELRTQLGEDERRLQQVLAMQVQNGNPLLAFGLLSELLEDDVSLTRYRLDAERIRIEGQADNAAALLQALTEHAAFTEVRAPMAFARDPRTQVERFALELSPPVPRVGL